MARAFLTPIDLSKNELKNAVIHVLPTSSAPSSPGTGQIYFDSTLGYLRVYNGSSWVTMDPSTTVTFGTTGDMSSSAVGDTAAAGTSGKVADAGHRHARESFGTPGSSAVGDAAAAGTATTVSRSDHTHGRESFGSTASTQAVGDAAAGGSAATPSRSDHKHAMPSFGSVTAETSFGGSSANGSASTIARSDHTHGTPTHDASAHSTLTLNNFSAPTSALSIGSQRLTNVATPSADTDAATKGYVDGVASGLDVKSSVRVATTGNINLSAPGSTIDGVTLSSGDRVLVKSQSTAADNGIYVFNGAAAVMTRATDADVSAEVTAGMFTFVEEGSTLAETGWVLATNNPITLGTTGLSFTQFNSSTAYSAGDGLTLSSTTFNVGAGTGITVNADDVAINTGLVARYKVLDITGNGSATSFALTHNLQQWVSVQIIDGASPYDQVECDVERTSSTVVTVKFATAPTNGKAYKAIVVG